MEDVLWYLFASSRGAPTRVEIMEALLERPQNANQLAEALGYDYTTIRHHLDVLKENNVIRSTERGYGDVYLLTDIAKHHRDDLEMVLDAVEGESR